MKFQFEKLGAINKAELELGDLTIICGKNNTGKTYVSYAIYGLLATWNNLDFKLAQEEIGDLLENGILKIDLKQFGNNILKQINKLSECWTQSIPMMFSANEEYFSETSCEVLIDYKPSYQNELQFYLKTPKGKEILKAFKEKESPILEVTLLVEVENEKLIPPTHIIKSFIVEALGRVLLGYYFDIPFIITAERIGISLFYRELDISKNVLVEQLQKQSKSPELFNFVEMVNNTVSRYAFPIKHNIDFIRDIFDIHSKKTSPLLKEHPEFAKDLKNLLGGEIKVINDQIFFVFKQARKNQIIPLYLSSSAVKSLLDLNFYIKHLAKEGDILFIDEPELNLHPVNQRKMARLFVRLIKAGIKVFITTHSDYIIKELNNLIILGNEFEERAKIMKKYKYTEADILDPASVKVYIAENQTLTPAPIDNLGIEIKSFDREIEEMKNMFDDMTETMEMAYEL